MEALIIILIAVVLLVVVGGAFFLRGRGDTDILERPPAAPPADATVLEEAPTEVVAEPEAPPEPEVVIRPSFRERIGRARESLAGTLGSILSRGVDNQTWEELEEALIRADVGLPATMAILETVRQQADSAKTTDPAEVLELLKTELKARLGGFDRSLVRAETDPSVWLFVGVNGVGKTTTIGKLAKQQIDEGSQVVMAAGDTFRAAAAEQLEMWADRAGAAIVRGTEGGDPSAVVFDA
ncbi:MAG: signal recognition particle receptor subunit alpha, partial [Acidimicrobiia bacterium]|nr:signal recognition particle receptor subunit alpha [Acidimicrobiia bacterium]